MECHFCNGKKTYKAYFNDHFVDEVPCDNCNRPQAKTEESEEE